MRHSAACLTLLSLIGPHILSCAAQEGVPAKARKVEKTDAEWAKQLTRAQYLVTRRKATEPAFSGKLLSNHLKGFYTCVCCDAELFTSLAKFDSGTGWPSFWRPVTTAAIDTAMDDHDGTERVEVMCQNCGAHLGHVFSDGPPPTGLRYCINSASLRFLKQTPAKPAPKRAKNPTKAKEATPAADESKNEPEPAK